MFIKNDNNELVTFVSEKAVDKKQDVISVSVKKTVTKYDFS